MKTETRNYYKEAIQILEGKTLLLPEKEHIKSLQELNSTLFTTLEILLDAFKKLPPKHKLPIAAFSLLQEIQRTVDSTKEEVKTE